MTTPTPAPSTPVSAADLVAHARAVLREVLHGAAEKWSYVTDAGPEAAVLGALASLTPEQASRPVAGSSVAAHASHIRFALEASTAWISGDRGSHDWSQSWTPSTVDAESWPRLIEDLRRAHERIDAAIRDHALTDSIAAGAAVGAAAHTAYHLGAIRQKIALLRNA